MRDSSMSSWAVRGGRLWGAAVSREMSSMRTPVVVYRDRRLTTARTSLGLRRRVSGRVTVAIMWGVQSADVLDRRAGGLGAAAVSREMSSMSTPVVVYRDRRFATAMASLGLGRRVSGRVAVAFIVGVLSGDVVDGGSGVGAGLTEQVVDAAVAAPL